ncbi:MAG: protein translocase subunit SecF [Candidatus Zambryskibacteria bacterium CG10_big_fil_rev_8_21_14_0_10_42_12]|uniref:Protein-export membrane protein SecF n=1 Tax=Candidatus Zambryskibacteria bacterium CG10_big_fil_rev_8_21_14_0_10_42_12 TaxID=1975115 RepID=A0A2H0QTV7_9BACT|nr:MAG: protein translocase subunit SecF [Candidatus Zambryskibacteria bacterium CG10_big_fil_rev_8_21_14_0_10_42_12]
MFAITHKKIYLTIGAILMLLSWIVVFVYGLKPSIDFVGGSILEYRLEGARPMPVSITEALVNNGYESVSTRNAGETNMVIRMKEITPEAEEEVRGIVAGAAGSAVVLERFNTVGPVAGAALLRKVIIATVVSVVVIMLFVMLAFRKVSEPVPSSRYAYATIVALIHDISIPAGVFAILGYTMGLEVDILFVTALLAVLGYSINDTIVVFDRIRENLKNGMKRDENFEKLVGRSLKETLARSFNTSFTLIITLLVLFFVSNEAVRSFVLALLIGIVAGTYSSIFLASPLLVIFGGKKAKS